MHMWFITHVPKKRRGSNQWVHAESRAKRWSRVENKVRLRPWNTQGIWHQLKSYAGERWRRGWLQMQDFRVSPRELRGMGNLCFASDMRASKIQGYNNQRGKPKVERGQGLSHIFHCSGFKTCWTQATLSTYILCSSGKNPWGLTGKQQTPCLGHRSLALWALGRLLQVPNSSFWTGLDSHWV